MNSGDSLGPYEIKAPLGAGGMGEVYRARDPRLERDVAIKVLPEILADDPERLARFEREAKLLAQLNHANIASIYGLEQDGDTRFIAMELVEGETLADRMEAARPGGLPLDEVLDIAGQITAALDVAHQSGVVHRDLKPANIMLTPAGKVKVLDFGLAKAYEPDSDAGPVSPDISSSPTMLGATRTGVIMGTAAYMSPEQAAGQPVDKRTDIWAFGVILFEMLSGERMFSGETAAHVMADVLRAEPEFGRLPESTPLPLRQLLRRCLQKRPGHRLRDIGDAAWELGVASSGDGEIPTPVPVAAASPLRLATVLPWAIAALAIGALAVGGFGTRDVVDEAAVRTLEIDLYGESPSFPELSPDGTKVAFWSRNADTLALVVQEVATGAARTVFETPDMGRGGMAWSPDGSEVAFHQYLDEETILTVVAAAGGPAREVATFPARGARFPRWAPEQRITVRTDMGIEGIDRVTGAREVILAHENFAAVAGDQAEIADHFGLEDGTFLFTNGAVDGFELYRWNGEVIELIAARPELAAGRIVFAGDGLLLFDNAFSSTGVWAMPYDIATGDTGAPFEIRAGSGWATASPDGTLMMRVGENQSASATETLRIDRDGTIAGTIIPAGELEARNITLSPDGKQLAAAIGNRDGREVWIYDVAGADAPRLLPNARSGLVQGWSPDGDRLLVIRAADTRTRVSTVVQLENVDGSGAAQVLVDAGEAKLSPDGGWLVHSRGPTDGLFIEPFDAAAVRDDTSAGAQARPAADAVTMFGAVSLRDFAISPNGKWVAYHHFARSEGLWLASFPTGAGARRLSTIGRLPRWSGDGTELFYVAGGRFNAGEMTAQPVDPESGQVGGPPQSLFAIEDIERGAMFNPQSTGYDVAPDGQSFVMVRFLTPRQGRDASRYEFIENWTKLYAAPSRMP